MKTKYLLKSIILCVLSFTPAYGDSHSAEDIYRQLNDKLTLTNKLVDFLEIDTGLLKNWVFLYLHGEDEAGSPRNLQLEFLGLDLAYASEEEIKKKVDRYVEAPNYSVLGSLAFRINSAKFHHSMVLGNQNHTYRTFYVGYGPVTDLETYTFEGTKFSSRATSMFTQANGKTITVVRTISIDKAHSPISIEISERKINGLLRTDLWSRKSTFYVDRLEWKTEPKKVEQTFGL